MKSAPISFSQWSMMVSARMIKPIVLHQIPLLLAVVLVACQPSTTPSTSTAPSLPADGSTATLTLEFPSKNGPVLLPTLTGDALTARFPSSQGSVDVAVERNGNDLTVSKPLTADPTGLLTVVDRDRPVLTAAYTSHPDLIDIAIKVPEAAFTFRVEPAETTAIQGSRSIRVQPGTTLKLVLPEGNVVLGEAPVNDDGEVGSVDGIMTGSLASLRLDTHSLQLDLQGSTVPVRIGPYESNFIAGNRLVHVIPGIPLFMAIGDNGIRIDGIAMGADGTVTQGHNFIKPLKDTLSPVVRSLHIDTGLYTGPWRLTRYEATFATGDRDITSIAADSSLSFQFGHTSYQSPVINPEQNGTFGPITVNDKTIHFNTRPIPIDMTNLARRTQVQPFETGYTGGQRTIYAPLMPVQAVLGLEGLQEALGTISVDATGTVTSQSPSLQVINGIVKPNTRTVQVDVGGSRQEWSAFPYELAAVPGSRSITMIRGMSGTIQRPGLTIAFTIDENGTVQSTDPHIQLTGGGMKVDLGV